MLIDPAIICFGRTFPDNRQGTACRMEQSGFWRAIHGFVPVYAGYRQVNK